MKALKLDTITANEKARLEEDIGNLINDTELRVPVILGKSVEGAYNPDTGAQTETWTRDPVYAIRGEFSTRELSYWQGTLEIGDCIFLLKKSDYLEDLGGELDRNDELLEFRYNIGNATFTNASVDVSGVGTAWVANAGVGNYIRVPYEEDYYKIATVTDDTNIVLASSYINATKTNEMYAIYTKWKVINVMKDVLNIIRKVHCRQIT